MKQVYLVTGILFYSLASFAAEVDVQCFGDIQNQNTKEHIQAIDVKLTIKKTSNNFPQWEKKTLVTSQNYEIRLTVAGGLMVSFYRIKEDEERFLGASVIPDQTHSWVNFNHSDEGFSLSGSCRVADVRK